MNENNHNMKSFNAYSRQFFNFFQGLPGFPALKNFSLIQYEKDDIFSWLTSLDDSRVCFCLIKPHLFLDKYNFALNDRDISLLRLTDKNLDFYCSVTFHERSLDSTVNLKTPFVFNTINQEAKQCTLESDYPYEYAFCKDLNSSSPSLDL